MNLRILKKLSKKAVPLLKAINPRSGLEYHISTRADPGLCDVRDLERKHWDRSPSAHCEPIRASEIIISPRRRRGTTQPYVRIDSTPGLLKGTPVVGWMSGYETPEWEEQSAWTLLAKLVFGAITDVVPLPEEHDDEFGPAFDYVQTVKLASPSAILRQARVLAGAQ